MARDLHPYRVQKCYACIQWEGNRTYFADKKAIKADLGEQGHCRLFHVLKKGSQTCERFDALL